jgi:hypothetical protein
MGLTSGFPAGNFTGTLGIADVLTWQPGARDAPILRQVSRTILDNVESEHMTYEAHSFGVWLPDFECDLAAAWSYSGSCNAVDMAYAIGTPGPWPVMLLVGTASCAKAVKLHGKVAWQACIPMCCRGTRLHDFFELLSTSRDALGKVYVSMVVARKYPFVAMQWHPEKNPFEFGSPTIPHSLAAVQLAQGVANEFVQVQPCSDTYVLRSISKGWQRALVQTEWTDLCTTPAGKSSSPASGAAELCGATNTVRLATPHDSAHV